MGTSKSSDNPPTDQSTGHTGSGSFAAPNAGPYPGPGSQAALDVPGTAGTRDTTSTPGSVPGTQAQGTQAQRAARAKAASAAADAAQVDTEAELATAETQVLIEGVQVAYENHLKSLNALASSLGKGGQVTATQLAAVITAAEGIGKTLAGLTPGTLDSEVPL